MKKLTLLGAIACALVCICMYVVRMELINQFGAMEYFLANGLFVMMGGFCLVEFFAIKARQSWEKVNK
jgi:hypothetical protein